MGKNKSNKIGKKRESVKEIERVEWQACTNKLILSLSPKFYPLLKIKDLFGHKPFRPIPSKWTISTTGFSYEVVHIKEVVPSLVLVLQHNWTPQTNILLWSHYYFFSCLCNFTYDMNLVVVLSFSLRIPYLSWSHLFYCCFIIFICYNSLAIVFSCLTASVLPLLLPHCTCLP